MAKLRWLLAYYMIFYYFFLETVRFFFFTFFFTLVRTIGHKLWPGMKQHTLILNWIVTRTEDWLEARRRVVVVGMQICSMCSSSRRYKHSHFVVEVRCRYFILIYWLFYSFFIFFFWTYDSSVCHIGRWSTCLFIWFVCI